MTIARLLAVLVFFLIARGFVRIPLVTVVGPYEAEIFAQVLTSAGLYYFVVAYFKIPATTRQDIFGAFTIKHAYFGAALSLAFLAVTYGESAVVYLSIAQSDPEWAYSLGHFREYQRAAHPFLSRHVMLFVLSNVVAPAIVEEFFFRGLLFPLMEKKYGLLKGAVICSCIFTALHFSKPVYLSVFIFSFGLCYIYARTKSLAPCIAAHFTFNLLAFVVQYYSAFHWVRAPGTIANVAAWIPELSLLAVGSVVIVIICYRWRGANFSNARGQA